MNLEESKIRNWGGPWTEEKLDTFEKYVLAYLTIMNAYRDKYGWKITYFDGFAGSGERTTLDEEYAVTANLFGEDDVTKADLDVYTGAAERVVRLEQKGVRSFDRYCFVEKNDKSRAALIERLDRYPTSGNKEYFQGDTNDILEKFAINLSFDSKHKALIFLDPFGMQLKWETIK
jgi:three-Cys-motif partner protein